MTLSLSRSLSPRTNIDNGSESLLEKSPKKFRSTNSWLESKKIQNALEERKVLLEEKRVEKLAQLSQGEWIPSSHLVKVTKKVGRHWATMGHTYLGELYLDPEEALFLLEANTIEIYFNGLPMSLQQAYSILLGSDSGCTLEEYRAFAHLTRFGYKVRRHRPETGGKRRRDEPLEIDVVGVIRRKKSSDTGGPENVVEVEDAIEVVDSVEATGANSVMNTPIPSQPNPSTSQVSNNVAPPADDDDIKFLEIVDTSKKRKVLSSVVIHDDIEISLAGDGSGNDVSSGQSIEQSDAQKKEGFKPAAGEMPAISIHSVSSDCELVEDCSDESRPTRGMYKRNLFAPAANSSKFPESSSSVSVPSTSRNNCRSEGKSGPRNEKANSAIAAETSDEVIVLSDDETKEDSKQAKELLRFYKEISLIELIDISGEDEEGKATNKASTDASSKVDENFDFWHVLGRIPTLEKGRMILRLPAPPAQLIPLNIQPSQDEYVLNVATSLLPQPSEDVNSTPRQGSERVSSHRGDGSRGSVGVESGGDGTRAAQDHHERSGGSSGGGFSSGYAQRSSQSDRPWSHSHSDHRAVERSSYLLPAPHASRSEGSNPNLWQQSLNRNAWNPLMELNNRTPATNYYSNPSMAMNCWGGQYQANNGRSLWSSLVYSERQFGGYRNASQQWTASSVTHFHHNAPQVNYQNYGQNSYGQNSYGQNSYGQNSYGQSSFGQNSYGPNSYGHNLAGSRSSQWQGNSSSPYGSRSGGRWQHQSGVWPRRGGSRHYSRRGRHIYPMRRANPQDHRAEDTYSESVIPKVPHARNWLELKIKSEKTKPVEPARMESSGTGIRIKPEVCQEDSKEVLPLLKPADSINIDAVQSKLQITSSGKDNYYNGPENYSSSLSIKFDLYMPNSNFRKSCPGLPKYRLSIVKSDDRVPKLKDTWYLTRDLNDEVPLLFAVSYTESVNFFSFSNVELPASMSQ